MYLQEEYAHDKYLLDSLYVLSAGNIFKKREQYYQPKKFLTKVSQAAVHESLVAHGKGKPAP